MKTIAILIIKALLTSLLAFGNSHAEVIRSIGDVHSVNDGRLIYREHHTFSKFSEDEFTLTEYKTIDGKLIASRKVDFQNGYASGYVFEQPELNIRTEVKRGKTDISYLSIQGSEKVSKSYALKDIETAIISAGMFNAVERNWGALESGKAVTFNLLVPDKERTYSMRLKRIKIEGSNLSKYLPTAGNISFELKINNGFLRLLVPAIELGYDADSRQLVFYQGPSNLKKSDGGKIGEIWITYKN